MASSDSSGATTGNTILRETFVFKDSGLRTQSRFVRGRNWESSFVTFVIQDFERLRMKKSAGFSTRCIHVGQEPEKLTGAVGVPIYATSTYAQDDIRQAAAWL